MVRGSTTFIVTSSLLLPATHQTHTLVGLEAPVLSRLSTPIQTSQPHLRTGLALASGLPNNRQQYDYITHGLTAMGPVRLFFDNLAQIGTSPATNPPNTDVTEELVAWTDYYSTAFPNYYGFHTDPVRAKVSLSVNSRRCRSTTTRTG